MFAGEERLDRGQVDRGGPKEEAAEAIRVETDQGYDGGGQGAVFARFRFCFVAEHGNFSYYITEKIVNAFLAGCVPVFAGSSLSLSPAPSLPGLYLISLSTPPPLPHLLPQQGAEAC